jgi:hypothetical protein
MAQTLALTAAPSPPSDGNSSGKVPTSTSRAPELVSSSSLIVVMIVYVLFGAAGFFAAAQLISGGNTAITGAPRQGGRWQAVLVVHSHVWNDAAFSTINRC